MSSKRLFCIMATEGMLLLILGLAILIFPKLINITFFITLGAAFIAYGIFKFVSSIINRPYGLFVCELLLGIYLFMLGIIMPLYPNIDIDWIIAFCGIYLILEGILTTSWSAFIKYYLHLWYLKLPLSAILVLFGLIILIKTPNISFTKTALFIGTAFILKGVLKIAMSKFKKIETYLNYEETPKDNNRFKQRGICLP